MSSVPRNRMAPSLRLAAYLLISCLWLSGCAWLLLDLFCRQHGELGSIPHPLEPPLMLGHGLLAVPVLYLLGWISPVHARDGWRFRQRRSSGGLLWLALLSVTGFALFFVDLDAPRRAFSVTHEALGVAAGAFALMHWLPRSGSAGRVPESGPRVP